MFCSIQTFAVLLCFWIALPVLQAEESGLRNVVRRGDFLNSRLRFEQDKVGHVAFMGGSITEMNGYRPMLMEWLQSRFPNTVFQFTDAGISSTCSTAGAFRLQTDVLDRGQVDLFFIEFAVNDDQDAMHPYEKGLRGMEGIVRHTLEHSPRAEIVITYFVNPGMLQKIQNGEIPVSIAAHEKVAAHYGATTIDLAKEVADQIKAGTLSWKVYGGVHPAPLGNAIPAKMIEATLSQAWDERTTKLQTLLEKAMPNVLDPKSYVHGRYIPVSQIELGIGWKLERPEWKGIPGSVRQRHAARELITCTEPGSELSFPFHGTAVGVECVAGPDAGSLEYSIDGGEWKRYNLSHRFSKGLHYPRTVVFSDDLEEGEHTIRIRLVDQQSDYELPPVARLLHFVAN